jgi:two-component system sensor histidine kinase UhpB
MRCWRWAFAAAWGVRVIGPDGPIGIVGALSTRPRTFRPDDASFLLSLANVLGAAHSLQRSESDRRRALDALLRSAEEERRRIAVELHDDLIQVMTATLLLLDRQITALHGGSDTSQVELALTARRTLAGAVDRTRRLTFELRPPLLESRGLTRALADMLAEVSTDTGLDAHFDGDIERLPEQVELLAYRTVAELVTNVRKHAAARKVTVSLAAADRTLTGEVTDDGRGFDVEHALDRSATRLHMGLDSTTERLRLAGGQLTITSHPGAGTRIRFTLPTSTW